MYKMFVGSVSREVVHPLCFLYIYDISIKNYKNDTPHAFVDLIDVLLLHNFKEK